MDSPSTQKAPMVALNRDYTITLPAEVVQRFHPSDRFFVLLQPVNNPIPLVMAYRALFRVVPITTARANVGRGCVPVIFGAGDVQETPLLAPHEVSCGHWPVGCPCPGGLLWGGHRRQYVLCPSLVDITQGRLKRPTVVEGVVVARTVIHGGTEGLHIQHPIGIGPG